MNWGYIVMGVVLVMVSGGERWGCDAQLNPNIHENKEIHCQISSFFQSSSSVKLRGVYKWN
jgi:hypothetical protein